VKIEVVKTGCGLPTRRRATNHSTGRFRIFLSFYTIVIWW
jgi:hypothetical protein